MMLHLLIPVGVFAFTTIGTPGPNNVMLTASGARFGYISSLPHIAGILIGSASLYFAVAAGLGTLFQAWPALRWALRVVGGLYLLYLAWRIASAPPPQLDTAGRARPLAFWQAALFQYANPKVWVMALTLAASFLPAQGNVGLNSLCMVAVMSAVGLPCLSFWAGFGALIGRYLQSARAWRVFHVVMGMLTAACLGFIISA